MTPGDMNAKLKEMAKAYPNGYTRRDMVPLLTSARVFAVRMLPAAKGVGGMAYKLMLLRIARLTDLLNGPFAKDLDGRVVNANVARPDIGGPLIQERDGGKYNLWTLTYRALTGPYIEASGIQGMETVQRASWDGLIGDLTALPRALAAASEQLNKWAKATPWKYVAIAAGLLGGWKVYKEWLEPKRAD